MNPRSYNQFAAIFYKDLLLELRSKEIVTTMLLYSLTVVVIFNFAYDAEPAVIAKQAPSILWIAFTFASTLGLNRAFSREQENGMMQGILLAPVDRGVIFISKFAGNVIFMLVFELITLPIMIVLLDLQVASILLPLLMIIMLGNIGFASVGTIFSTISGNTRSREIMLPVLLFPVSIPVILSSIKATTALFAGSTGMQMWSWVRILGGFDLIYLVICFLLYEYVVEE